MRIAQYSTVLVTLLFVACSSDQKAAHQKPDGPPIGHWERLTEGPISAIIAGHAVTDREYVTWAGIGAPDTPFLYDLASDTWRTGSDSGSPVGRISSSGVWTGSEVIFWGGVDDSSYPTKKPNGAYNPTTNSWRLISSANGPSPRDYVTPVWAGTEMIVWGGADTSSNYNSPPILGDAYAYNPTTDTWRTLSSEGAPSPRIEVISTWTGSELLIWGGTADSNSIYAFDANRVYLKSGAAYNPITDTWRPMAAAGAPSQGRPIASAWTGTELLVWHSFKGEGAAYNPRTDSWRPMDSRGPLLQHGGCGTWTGKYFVVCGDGVEPQGELYDPAEDRWYLMESQFVDTGPGSWDGGNGYGYNGSVYIFGGYDVISISDLWGCRYAIPSDSADAQP